MQKFLLLQIFVFQIFGGQKFCFWRLHENFSSLRIPLKIFMHEYMVMCSVTVVTVVFIHTMKETKHISVCLNMTTSALQEDITSILNFKLLRVRELLVLIYSKLFISHRVTY